MESRAETRMNPSRDRETEKSVDKNAYPTGIKVSREDMKQLNLSPAKFHGKDWNYAIKPRQQRS